VPQAKGIVYRNASTLLTGINKWRRIRQHDKAFDCWLATGDYASRPPGELHGPFHTDVECIVLEISYPSQAIA